MDLHVLACPSCGAPLPAAPDGEHFTCARCGAITTKDGGAAAALHERQSRLEAEALFAKLGRPPTWSQRVALVLTNGWVWLLGSPFVLAALVRLGTLPVAMLGPWWERRYHERLLHVVTPTVGWLLGTGPPVLLAVALLGWSLLGARLSARRELQAALASRPPKVEGGPAACRNCGADLVVAQGALGERCRHCGADNLLALSPGWIARARRVDAKLRLTTDLASKQDARGRRRVLRAASWRVPLIAVFVLLFGSGAQRMSRGAGWRDMRLAPGTTSTVYEQMTGSGDAAHRTLHAIARCERAADRAALRDDATLRLDDDSVCDGPSCRAPAIVALTAGDELALSWVTPAPAVAVRFAIAPRDWTGGLIGQDGFGDELAVADAPAGAPGAVVFRGRAALSGWYYVALRGARGAAVEPCISPGAAAP